MSQPTILEIQKNLQSLGFDPGPVDGQWGRKTMEALKAFQQSNDLVSDGVFGPATLSKLFPGYIEVKDEAPVPVQVPAASSGDAVPSAAGASTPGADGSEPSNTKTQPLEIFLPWMEEAKKLLGLKEAAGSANNEQILSWADMLDLKYDDDDIPWCGLFTAHCIGSTLTKEALPGNPLGARQWEKFGTTVEPRFGAVMVFWRDAPNSGKGHVGFYAGESNDGYLILGGNQSDCVSYAWLPKANLVSAHWPISAASLTSGVVRVEKNADFCKKQY